jgi:hypothetical protein
MAKKPKSLPSDIVADVTGKPQTTEEKNKGGRPTKYTPEIARLICEQLSDGIPLRQICRENKGFPAWRTVYDWMWRDAELSTAIARARDIGYDALAEECLYIADTPHMGKKKVFTSGADDDEDSVTVTEEDMLGHRKLQIETRLKLLAKFNPKKYGEYRATEEKIDPMVIDAEIKLVMDVAIKRLELIRIAE